MALLHTVESWAYEPCQLFLTLSPFKEEVRARCSIPHVIRFKSCSRCTVTRAQFLPLRSGHPNTYSMWPAKDSESWALQHSPCTLGSRAVETWPWRVVPSSAAGVLNASCKQKTYFMCDFAFFLTDTFFHQTEVAQNNTMERICEVICITRPVWHKSSEVLKNLIWIFTYL